MHPNDVHGEEYDYIYSRVPRLCVDVVVETNEGIILTKRTINPWKGTWHIPGGGVAIGERLEDAVIRVAKEELNLDVSIIESIGHIEDINTEQMKKHAVSIVFKVKIKQGKIKLNKDADEFMITKKIPLPIIPAQEKFLRDKMNMASS